jgi:hypothetical protein
VFVARNSEPTAGEDERSEEGGILGFTPDYEFNNRFVVENLYNENPYKCASARAGWRAFCCPR